MLNVRIFVRASFVDDQMSDVETSDSRTTIAGNCHHGVYNTTIRPLTSHVKTAGQFWTGTLKELNFTVEIRKVVLIGAKYLEQKCLWSTLKQLSKI
jgi:hypothetical protein